MVAVSQVLHWFDLATDPGASCIDYGTVADRQAERALQAMCSTLRGLLRDAAQVGGSMIFQLNSSPSVLCKT